MQCGTLQTDGYIIATRQCETGDALEQSTACIVRGGAVVADVRCGGTAVGVVAKCGWMSRRREKGAKGRNGV